jgi:cell division protein FtsQ
VPAESKNSRRPSAVAAPQESAASPSEATQRTSRAVLWSALKAALGLAFVLSLASAVAYGARHFAVTSSRFGIEHLLLEGSTRFSEAELAKFLDIKMGDNLFALDLEQKERKLADHPWVASASLTRKLPGTLEVKLVEYQAEALAAIGDTLYLITRNGTPIVPYGVGERGDYPIISGVSLEELAADRARALERLAQGASVLRHYERSEMAATYPAQELYLESDGSMELLISEQGITLKLGKGPVQQKLLMAARVVGKVRARGETPALVFLDNEAHPERVVVRLR